MSTKIMIIAETKHLQPTEFILYEGKVNHLPHKFSFLITEDASEENVYYLNPTLYKRLFMIVRLALVNTQNFYEDKVIEGFKPLIEDTGVERVRIEIYEGMLNSDPIVFTCKFGGKSLEVHRPRKVLKKMQEQREPVFKFTKPNHPKGYFFFNHVINEWEVLYEHKSYAYFTIE